MFKQVCILFISILLVSCSGKSEAPAKLTPGQKATVERYATQLVKSFNSHDYSLIRDSWNHNTFKKRVNGLSKTGQAVFNHIFEKDVKDDIKYTNLLIINRISKEGGQTHLTRTEHFDIYSEITFAITFPGSYSFIRYRIEMIGNKPYLTDMYDFRDGTWYSESIKNIVNLNVRFDGLSEERRMKNMALRQSDEFLKRGDTLGALVELMEIPDTHWVGNGLSLKRLNLAISVNDSVYTDVLHTEIYSNQSLYLKYLYCLKFNDPEILSNVYEELKSLTGSSERFDSLILSESTWQ